MVLGDGGFRHQVSGVRCQVSGRGDAKYGKLLRRVGHRADPADWGRAR